jgi:hypothetical protein
MPQLANNEFFTVTTQITGVTETVAEPNLVGISSGIDGGNALVVSYGGGGGGGTSTPPVGTELPPIVQNTPGTINSDRVSYLFITSNQTGASIFVNGVNTFKVTPDKINLILSDILLEPNGTKEITLQKEGFLSNEKYVIDVVRNDSFNFTIQNIDVNPYSSLFGYQTIPSYNPITGEQNSGIDFTSGTNQFVGVASPSGVDFRGGANFSYSQVRYGSINPYQLRVTYYVNDVQQNFVYNALDVNINVNFDLVPNRRNIPIEPVEDTFTLTITVDSDDRAIVIKNAQESITLKQGTNQILGKQDDVFSISSSDVSKFRITRIETSALGKQTLVTDVPSETAIGFRRDVQDSLSGRVVLDTDYSVILQTEEVLQFLKPIPKIELANPEFDRTYNINTKADIPIAILNVGNGLEKITAYVNNEKFVFDNLDSYNINPAEALFVKRAPIGIQIPASAIKSIGVYRFILVPSNSEGDGESITINYNVIDEIFVGVPDIRNIRYPSELRGPDYVGYDVPFRISFDSVDADYVRIYAGESYYQVAKEGNVQLNVKTILEQLNGNYSQNDELVSFQLKLIPYNTSGKEIVIGKEELITIKFIKGKLTIPRNVALNRIAEGFKEQIDKIEPESDSSKYLTHLLHFGGGDNKVITTWTGSEGTIILKLYEALPTSVQENQLVWISKPQSNTIIETSTLIADLKEYCTPLKGPNFSLDSDNGIGYKVFDELIATGSLTSTDLLNLYADKIGIDTTKINIDYVSGSEYTFSNFTNFSSAEERINNFIYKVQLIENYQSRYDSLANSNISNSNWTASAAVVTEATRTIDSIREVKRTFDGFENWLYTDTSSSLSYPKTAGVPKASTSNDVVAWYNLIISDAITFDKENPNYLVNNIPEFIKDDYENKDFITFLDMMGYHFDTIWGAINGLNKNRELTEDPTKGMMNKMVYHMLESLGWEGRRAFDSQFLWEYALGKHKDGTQKYSKPLYKANEEVWRRILNNLPYLLKHKGTARAMKAIMACYGVPQSMLTIMEFGGPQNPTEGGTTEFTFDDRTAAINLTPTASVRVPWHTTPSTSEYPTTIEFRFKPSEIVSKATLISGSEWTLDLVQTTGSFGKLEFNFGGNDAEAPYFTTTGPGTPYFVTTITYAFGPDLKTGSLDFPISTEYYSNVAINRYNYAGTGSLFEVWLGTSDGQRIITSVSMSILYNDNQWETGSNILIGGNGYTGSIDEFRLWKVPLEKSKFDNHVKFPDAINGNSYTASTADLLFRLDFEYPKDRTNDNNIKNVAINTEYGESYAYAQRFISASLYPYQYTPYDRTVTATVPSLGYTYGNKIRFEDIELVGDLSYKVRATKKSFDRAPIDSSRLGLFFSPMKELNMDILKAFGDFNIDNYIGDPSDDYKETYSELENLREYYFERLDRNIYEYIQLVRYIDKSLFDVLADLAPARAKISKGLLIEPHFLERSKTRWDKPQSERGDYDTSINIENNNQIEFSYDTYDATLDAKDGTSIQYEISNWDSEINIGDETVLETETPFYDTNIDYNSEEFLEADAPMYDVAIQAPTGETLTGEYDSFQSQQIGMDRNSLANLGFGLFGIGGKTKVVNYDEVFGNTSSSIQNVYITKNQYSYKVPTQVAGWPVNGAQLGDKVIYEDVSVTAYNYKISIVPLTTSVNTGGDVVESIPLNGYLPTHYKFVNGLGEGLQRSYFKGSQQTAATTPDGLDPVETFTTNPNILRVAKTGRGSGEPILEVD